MTHKRSIYETPKLGNTRTHEHKAGLSSDQSQLIMLQDYLCTVV